MCSFSSTCPGIFITFGSRSSVFAKSTEQTAEDFLRRRSRSVHSGPFQGTTSRWMETPCYTCLGPLPRPGDWKRHPVEVMEHNEAKRTFAASPTSSRALENSWRFLKASRRTRWKCVSSFCPQHGSFFYHIRLVGLFELYIHAQFRDLQLRPTVCIPSAFFFRRFFVKVKTFILVYFIFLVMILTESFLNFKGI